MATPEQIIQSVTDNYGIISCDDCAGLKESWANADCEIGKLRVQFDGPADKIGRIIEFILAGCPDIEFCSGCGNYDSCLCCGLCADCYEKEETGG